MDMPPPTLYVLDENAAHCTRAVEFEKKLDLKSTAREGNKKNTAPPAALLAPEAHESEEVAEELLKKLQLLTCMLDETAVAGTKREIFNGNDVEL